MTHKHLDHKPKTDLRIAFLLQLVLPCLYPLASGELILFQQTPPGNSSVCPGQLLVYSCTTESTGVLEWRTPGQPGVVFTITDPVNSIKVQEEFTFGLIDINLDKAIMTSTAVAEMAKSSLDGLQIECDDGLSTSHLYVDVADGPANCSNVTVHCDVIRLDISEVDLQIRLLTNSHFKCAVGFLVEFNGENKTAPLGSPSINFTIDTAREMHFLEGMIYTLDNESRIGQSPCIFGIPGPSAVGNITVQDCNADYVLIAWTPSVITGCLNGDTRLEYRVELSFGDVIFLYITSNTSVEVPLISDSQVNITPVLPDLQLIGTPLSTNLNKVVASCLETTTPSTTESAKGSDNTDVVNALGGIIGGLLLLLVVLLLVVLLLIVLVVKFSVPCFPRNKGIQPNTPGQPNEDAENAEGIQLLTSGQPNKDAENAEEEQDDSEPKKRKDGYQRIPTQEPKEILITKSEEPMKQTKKVEARTPGGLQELGIFNRHSPELRDTLINMKTPMTIAVALWANCLLLRDTLEKMEKMKEKHDERAKLLVHDIENKIAVSRTGKDFLILCEILYKHQELRKISTQMIEEYEKERGPETCFHFAKESVSGETRKMLEKYYAENKSPSTSKKQEIADELQLHYATVGNWFRRERATDSFQVKWMSLPEAEKQEDPNKTELVFSAPRTVKDEEVKELVFSAPRTVKDEGVKAKSRIRRNPSLRSEDVCFRVSHSKDAEDDQDVTNWVIFTMEKYHDGASCPSETTLKEEGCKL